MRLNEAVFSSIAAKALGCGIAAWRRCPTILLCLSGVLNAVDAP